MVRSKPSRIVHNLSFKPLPDDLLRGKLKLFISVLVGTQTKWGAPDEIPDGL